MVKTNMQKGRTRAWLSRGVGMVVAILALVVTAAPSTLYATPRTGASITQNVTKGIVQEDSKTNLVTRGRLAQQVANAAGFDEDPGDQIFEDVPPGSHYYDWVNRLARRGVIGGVQCGTKDAEPCVGPLDRPYFRPDTGAMRGQIAKVISNAAGFNDEPTGWTFQDVPPGSTFYEWVQRLSSRGLMDGYPCGVAPAGPCYEPDNLPYFQLFDSMSMNDLVKVINAAFRS